MKINILRSIQPALFRAFLLLLLLSIQLMAENAQKYSTSSNKTLGEPQAYKMNINNISTWIYGDGRSDNDNNKPGFTYPKGSGKQCFFQSGFVWGGKVNGEVRVGGTTYRTGVVPGIIKPDGTAEDPSAAGNRMFRVRRDWKTGDFTAERADDEGTDEQIRARYEKDWNEWPASKGAPYEDVDHNGSYDPAVDIPGFPGADQTIWYATNDLNNDQALYLYGSPSMGIEVQTTIWGYASKGTPGNMIFRSYKMINKSQNDFTDMYVSMWSDPDDGNSDDDFAGCDTVLSLGYIYNSKRSDDIYGANPPAAGFKILQGPAVMGASDDYAIIDISRNYRVQGKKNLGMTSFYYFINSDPTYSDPDLGEYKTGTLQMYNLLQGKSGTTGEYYPVPQCLGGGYTKFPLSGNPNSQMGYVDGLLFPKGDRRMGLSAGPFNMAKGDTQEVVIAQIAAGYDNKSDHLEAVELLKDYARRTDMVYKSMFTISEPVFMVSASDATLKSKIDISFEDKNKAVSSISVNLRKMKTNGSAASVVLYDDGQHGDKMAGDGIFANSVETQYLDEALYMNAQVVTKQGYSFKSNWVYSDIVTIGEVRAASPVIFSDNLNMDGQANPSENIRFGVTITNNTLEPSFSYVNCSASFNSQFVKADKLTLGKSFVMKYDPADATSYFTLDIPGDACGKFPVVIKLFSDRGGKWQDTVYLDIKMPAASFDTSRIVHESGSADGNFDILVVDPQKVTDHKYSVSIDRPNPEDTTLAFTLRDSTVGKDLLVNHPLPDKYAHNIPVIDGFKLLPGSVNISKVGMKDYVIPSGERRWTWEGGEWGSEGFNGAIGFGGTQWFVGSTVDRSETVNTLIKFAKTDDKGNIAPDADKGNVSRAYRYVRLAQNPPAKTEFAPYIINTSESYAYQDMREVPFAAFDTEHGNRRLAIGFSENNSAGGLLDGKYWPGMAGVNNISTSGTREWFFIFDTDYSETPDQALTKNIIYNVLPVLWFGTVNRIDDTPYSNDDQFLILANHPIGTKDVWTFEPSKTVGVKEMAVPQDFSLEQNYPNPFNPSTTIKFALPSLSRVKITIFNILGQVVSVLKDDDLGAGYHQVKWNATQNSSGIYFCSIEAKPEGGQNSFRAVKKMMLVK